MLIDARLCPWWTLKPCPANCGVCFFETGSLLIDLWIKTFQYRFRCPFAGLSRLHRRGRRSDHDIYLLQDALGDISLYNRLGVEVGTWVVLHSNNPRCQNLMSGRVTPQTFRSARLRGQLEPTDRQTGVLSRLVELLSDCVPAY